MASTRHFEPGSTTRGATITAAEAYRSSPSAHYGHLVAQDSSSIHAGDVYTTNQTSVNNTTNNISINGPAIMITTDILQTAGVRSLIQKLESTAVRMERLQRDMRRLVISHKIPSPDGVSKRRRKRRCKDKTPRSACFTQVSTTFDLLPPDDHETVLTMKVRFTITYAQHSHLGFTSHWYEYSIVVANPTHRRLLSSHSGIGIANLGVNNKYFPQLEVCITLEDGWVWDGDRGSDTSTRTEVFKCRQGRQTIERDIKFKRSPLLSAHSFPLLPGHDQA